MQAITIVFLPSRYGEGFASSVYRHPETPDGWWPELYDHLRGVALYPEEPFPFPAAEITAFNKVAVTRLKAQGVVFLKPRDADDYHEREGKHWCERLEAQDARYWGGLGAWWRWAMIELRWKLWPPHLPVSGRL
jgi:hypothetical protein